MHGLQPVHSPGKVPIATLYARPSHSQSIPRKRAIHPRPGVHEHLNNAKDKKYSRNLKSKGKGIELFTVAPGWDM